MSAKTKSNESVTESRYQKELTDAIAKQEAMLKQFQKDPLTRGSILNIYNAQTEVLIAKTDFQIDQMIKSLVNTISKTGK